MSEPGTTQRRATKHTEKRVLALNAGSSSLKFGLFDCGSPLVRVLSGAIDRIGTKIRVVNVVDLMKLQSESEHPHGLSDRDFDQLFTTNKPIIFAFHGYPWLIHRLTYRRTNHKDLHVRGYKEEGAITTAFDMTVLNDADRLHLVMDVIDPVPGLSATGAYLKQELHDKLIEHRRYICQHGEDMPEIRNWKWKAATQDVRR